MISRYDQSRTFLFDAFRFEGGPRVLFAMSLDHQHSISMNVDGLDPEKIIEFVRSLINTHAIKTLIVDRRVATIGMAQYAHDRGIDVVAMQPCYQGTLERMTSIIYEAA